MALSTCLEYAVGLLAIQDDGGAAVLGGHPRRLHLGRHAAAPVLALAARVHHAVMHLQIDAAS